MSKRPLNEKEIISLLSKLKDETPEYPVDLLEARKVAFLKQAATLNIPGEGHGGEGGHGSGTSGSGGSGAGLGGGTAAQGFILQALIGFSIVAALLLTAFAYRERISEILRENEGVAVEQPLVAVGSLIPSSVDSTPSAIATESPVVSISPTGVIPGIPIEAIPGSDMLNMNGPMGVTDPLDSTKTNPGLHLGQTPGAPAAPGLGNPGNINQPDRPERPDKPDKPDKPDRPDNSNRPDNPGNRH